MQMIDVYLPTSDGRTVILSVTPNQRTTSISCSNCNYPINHHQKSLPPDT
jgi:hypothetical protein